MRAALADTDEASPHATAARSALARIAGIPALAAVPRSPAAPPVPDPELRSGAPGPAQVVSLRTRTVAIPRPPVDPAVQSAVEEAIANRRVLRMTYLDGKGRPTEREVEPSGVLNASGHRYLVGWCRSRQDGRGFRLDRIRAAEVTSEPIRDRDMAAVLGPLGRGGEESPGPVLRGR